MRNRIKVKAILLSLLLLIGYIPIQQAEVTYAAINKEYQDSKPLPFRELTADEMVKEMGTGWNLGNTMDGHTGFTPNETLWQTVETTQELIDAVHDYGFNTIRIPVTWGTMIDDENDYLIDEGWISRVQDIVDYAIRQDMYVIINVHHDGAEQNGWLRVAADDIQPVKDKFVAVWNQIATRFKNYDEHLIFEDMNEVTGDDGSKEGKQKDTKVIMELNQLFVDLVRQSGGNNDKRWLSVPGRYTNIESMTDNKIGFDIPKDPVQHIFISVHYYDWTFGLMETHSNSEYNYPKAKALLNSFDALVTKFTSKGIPVILGEYGAVNKNNTKDRAYFNEVVNRICQMDGIVPVYWDNGSYDMSLEMDYSFTLIDRSTTELVYKDIKDAIMRGMYLPAKTDDLTDVKKGEEITIVPVESLSLSADAVSIMIGETTEITTSRTPANNNDVLLWKTQDADIATVYNGMIRGRGIGTTQITVYSQSGTVEKTIPVTVSALSIAKPITEIQVEQDKIELKQNESCFINAGTDSKSPDYLTYRSLNTKVATVSSLGKIVAKKAGSTYIVISAASGITKTILVTVSQSEVVKSLDLALNVYYNDNVNNYFSNEVGQPITVTEDGQYTLSFDCSQDLSSKAGDAGVVGLERLTAIYIKDNRVTKGKAKKSPLLSCDIMYNKIVVDQTELNIIQKEPKSAIKPSGILDTNDPLNSWDGSSVDGVTVEDHRLTIDGLTNPQKVEVTFTLSNLVFNDTEITPDVITISEIEAVSDTKVNFEGVGEQTDLSISLVSDGDSYVSFISSDESIATMVNKNSSIVSANGSLSASVLALQEGTCTITAITENGLSTDFTITVEAKKEEMIPTTEPTKEPDIEPTSEPEKAEDKSNESLTQPQTKTTNSSTIIIIVIDVILVAAAVIVYFVLRKPKKK